MTRSRYTSISGFDADSRAALHRITEAAKVDQNTVVADVRLLMEKLGEKVLRDGEASR